ncbi:MAG: hypothetical protein CMB77_07460 [Euryarchaeota archaeon]|nr:hypothetical protein [Euryarchaeota archaeon]
MGLIENFGRVADTYIREKERLTSADVERVREQTGHPFWPSEVLRDTIIFLAMLAVLCFYSWIIPPPLHNSADPFAQAGFVFPDWYVLFSYGYLRWAEYLPQFDVPLGPIGEFFGQPVFPWNAAWWGSLLTGIPVGILILPPLLGGRAQRGVENPWAATLGMVYLAHIWFISVFSINIFLDLYNKNRSDFCQLDAHKGLACGTRPPWLVEVFNVIPWVLTVILIWITIYFLARWFMLQTIGSRTTPAVSRRISGAGLAIAIIIGMLTFPAYDNGFWDYGGLGAMDDIETLEGDRSQPMDTIVEDTTAYAVEGDLIPAADWLSWSAFQPTNRYILDYAQVNGAQSSSEERNAASETATLQGISATYSILPTGNQIAVRSGTLDSVGQDIDISTIDPGKYEVTITILDPSSDLAQQTIIQPLTIEPITPAPTISVTPERAMSGAETHLGSSGELNITWEITDLPLGIEHSVDWRLLDAEGNIAQTLLDDRVLLGQSSFNVVTTDTGLTQGVVTITSIPSSATTFSADLILDGTVINSDTTPIWIEAPPEPIAVLWTTQNNDTGAIDLMIDIRHQSDFSSVPQVILTHLGPSATESVQLISLIMNDPTSLQRSSIVSDPDTGLHEFTLSIRDGSDIHSEHIVQVMVAQAELAPSIEAWAHDATVMLPPDSPSLNASSFNIQVDAQHLISGENYNLELNIADRTDSITFTASDTTHTILLSETQIGVLWRPFTSGTYDAEVRLLGGEGQNLDVYSFALLVENWTAAERLRANLILPEGPSVVEGTNEPIGLSLLTETQPVSVQRNIIMSGLLQITDEDVLDTTYVDVNCRLSESVRNAGTYDVSISITLSGEEVTSLQGCENNVIQLDVGQRYEWVATITASIIPDADTDVFINLIAYQPLRLYTVDGPFKGQPVDLNNASQMNIMGCTTGKLDTCSEIILNPNYHLNPKSLDAKLIYSLFIPCLGVGAIVWVVMRGMARGYEYEMNKCYGCDLCDDACPVRLFNGGDKLNIIYNTWNNEHDGVPMYSCLTCGACTSACPQLVDYDSYVDIRRNLVVGGPASAEIPHTVLQAVLSAEAEDDSSFVSVEDYPIDSNVGYYPGCVDYIDQEMVFSHVNEGEMNLGDSTDAAFKIFDAMELDVAYLGRDLLKCCGHDQKWQGMTEVFEKLKAYNQKKVQATGIDTLVTSCAECFRTFARDYELDQVKVMHTTEYLLESGIDLQMMAPEGTTVTYHDPCRMGRQMGIYDEPRELIGKVENVELVEMEHSGEDALCCGVSSMMACNENSRLLRVTRFDEAKATGAEVMLTSCPKCVSHFECLKFEGDPRHDVEILDVVSFLARQIDSEGVNGNS